MLSCTFVTRRVQTVCINCDELGDACPITQHRVILRNLAISKVASTAPRLFCTPYFTRMPPKGKVVAKGAGSKRKHADDEDDDNDESSADNNSLSGSGSDSSSSSGNDSDDGSDDGSSNGEDGSNDGGSNDDSEKEDEDDEQPAKKKGKATGKAKAAAKAVAKKGTKKVTKEAVKKAVKKAKKEVKKESSSNGEKKVVKAKSLRKTERLEEARKAYKWWEAPKLASGVNWKYLEHAGICFAPAYVAHGIPLLYGGKPVELTPEQEEVASFFAAIPADGPQLGNAKTKPVFEKNFFEDFREVLGPSHEIRKFELCDFSKIKAYLDNQKNLKKASTDEEKAVRKAEKEQVLLRYGYALIDGRVEKVRVWLW
jgi:hypothetical protein